MTTKDYFNKTPNPNCPNCKGAGKMWYADSWDSDNGEDCWVCFPPPIVSVNIAVVKNKTHTKITCGKGRSFEEVLKGLKECVKALQDEIKNKKKCPMHKSPTFKV